MTLFMFCLFVSAGTVFVILCRLVQFMNSNLSIGTILNSDWCY